MNTQQQKPENPLIIFRNDLDQRAGEYAKLLPPGITPEMFARVAITAVQRKPFLLRCDRHSLLIALLEAAEDGLLPDEREGALVPYKQNVKVGENWEEKWIVQWLPMPVGVRKQVWEADRIILDTCVVYDRDEWSYQRGDNPRIIHTPKPGPRGIENVVAAYSVAVLPDGRKMIDWLWKAEIDQLKTKSATKGGGPWNDPIFYPEMAIKSVVHHHSKSLPLSSSSRRTLERGPEFDGMRAIPHDEPRHEAAGETPAALTYAPGMPMEPVQVKAERSVEATLGAMTRGEQVAPPPARRRRTKEEMEAARAADGRAKGNGGSIASGGGGGSVVAGQGVPGGAPVQGAQGGGTTAESSRMIAIDPDGTKYYVDTGEIIEQTEDGIAGRDNNEEAEAASGASGRASGEAAEQARAQPVKSVDQALAELRHSPQPVSRMEYLSWVETKYEYAVTDNEREALRLWWGETGGLRQQVGITQADTKTLADKMRRVQPA